MPTTSHILTILTLMIQYQMVPVTDLEDLNVKAPRKDILSRMGVGWGADIMVGVKYKRNRRAPLKFPYLIRSFGISRGPCDIENKYRCIEQHA